MGAWIGTCLLERGEDPKRIRLLDLNPPSNPVLKAAILQGMQYIKVDMTDLESMEAAFQAPWDDSVQAGEPQPEITVFQTAANIRFYERHASLIDKSARVNVIGTQNVIQAAKAAGVSILLYTSSGSSCLRRSRFLLWPWETEPPYFLQIVTDDDNKVPKRHGEFFSNYAYTKMEGERLTREADRSPSGNGILRTGILRPGNAIFGPGGDMIFGSYLIRQGNPSWIANIIQSFNYVENCVEAHLCYERRLIELHAGSKNPDIGGQAFCIADPGPTQTYGDIYTVLETLTDGVCHFPYLSPTPMLLLAYVIEFYYVARHRLVQAGWRIAKVLPAVEGDIINLQPSLFALTQVHLVLDDSRARLSPEEGGLGYQGVWTSLEGAYKTCVEYKAGVGLSGKSASSGISFGGKFTRTKDGKKTTIVKHSPAAPIDVVSET